MAGMAIALVALVVVGSIVAWGQLHPPLTPPVASPKPTPQTGLHRSPSLGLQFWQGGQLAVMSLQSANQDIVQVSMTKAPFEIWFPRHSASTAVQVCAWTDNSIFTMPADGDLSATAFGEGRGLADYAYGSGVLFLDNQAHNYWIDTRIEHASADMDRVYISTIWIKGDQGTGIPISQSTGNLYLAVFVDLNGDKKAEVGEYEYVVLKLSPP
jgi:hypothetical protein